MEIEIRFRGLVVTVVVVSYSLRETSNVYSEYVRHELIRRRKTRHEVRRPSAASACGFPLSSAPLLYKA